MPQDNLCQRCKKSKTTSGGGFVTQFIDVCRCDQMPLDQYLTIQMCSQCGMRVPRKSGTMTQWIFGQGNCQCENPAPVNTQIEAVPDPDWSDVQTQYEGSHLILDPEKFPTERYMPKQELGKGASGTVYLSIDKMLNKAVAVKTLINLSPEQLISFQDEARATAKLDHPNIIKLIDFGVSNSEIPYMVMEYVAGISLEDYIRESGRLNIELFKTVFVRLCNSLDYAHKHNVFHRDIKPSNIILFETDDGVDIKLIDFGIAKAKKESGMVTVYNDNTLAGTPGYMAPDVVNGETYDARSETYSLGCVMFEALAGKPPFLGETALETLSLHIHNQPPELIELNPSIDQEVSELVARCLAKEKEKRFQNMEDLLQSLNEIKGDNIDSEYKSDQTDIEEKKSGTGKKNLLIPAAILVILLIGCIAFVTFRNSEKVDTDPHQSRAEKKSKSVVDDISSLSHQSQVKFANVDLSGEAMKSLVGKSIGELNFNECVLDENSFQYMTRVRDLHHLTFYNCKLSMSNFEAFDQNSSVTKIELRKMNVDGIGAISKMGLFVLTIYNCEREKNDPTKLLNFSKMKTLRNLSVDLFPLTKTEIQSLSNLRNLEFLTLDLNKRPSHLIPISSKLESLHSIYLRNTVIDREFAKGLSECPNLNSLSLIFCTIEEPGAVKELVKAKELNSISYASCSFSEQTKKEFAQFKQIGSLKLAGVYPEILKNLSRVNIDTLVLTNNSYLDDNHLKEILAPGFIKKVKLVYCPNVSKSYLKQLDEHGQLEKHEELIPVNDDSELFKLFQKSDY